VTRPCPLPVHTAAAAWPHRSAAVLPTPLLRHRDVTARLRQQPTTADILARLRYNTMRYAFYRAFESWHKSA